MRTKLSVAEGLEYLKRVEWDVELTGLSEDDPTVPDPRVQVTVEDVEFDTEALDAPVARVRVVAKEPVSIHGLTLCLKVTLWDGEYKACSWTSQLDHDDLEAVPFYAADTIAWRDMDTTEGLHTARAWYSRSLPRTWFAVDVACSSLALVRIL